MRACMPADMGIPADILADSQADRLVDYHPLQDIHDVRLFVCGCKIQIQQGRNMGTFEGPQSETKVIHRGSDTYGELEHIYLGN